MVLYVHVLVANLFVNGVSAMLWVSFSDMLEKIASQILVLCSYCSSHGVFQPRLLFSDIWYTQGEFGFHPLSEEEYLKFTFSIVWHTS